MTHWLASRTTRLLSPLVALVLFLVAWQVLVSACQLPAILLPGPVRVFAAAWRETSRLTSATGVTLLTAVAGLALSLLVGVLTAMAFSQSRWLRAACFPYAILLQTVPIVAIAPIIVIWLGEGTAAVIVIAFIVSLFPIITNGTTGMLAVSPELDDFFRLNHASRWQRLTKLQLPGAVPFLVTGAKISSGLAVLGAIVGEYFAGAGAARPGLGYLIFSAKGQYRTDFLFACVAASTLLGVACFAVVGWLGERRMRAWHDSSRGTSQHP